MRSQLAAFILALGLLCSGSVAFGGIELESPPAVAGQPATIVATDRNGHPLADRPVEVTYYPNSEVKRVTNIGRTDNEGRLRWTPETAGLAAISIGDEKRTVAIRYDGVPPGAVVIFLLASTLLFGGIVYGVKKLR